MPRWSCARCRSACERVDEHTIRPVARAGLPAKSFASIDRKTGKPKTANIVLAIAAKLVIIGLQGLPFSPAALKPASWVIVVVWIVLGLALRLMSLRSRREWRIAVAARKPQVIAVVGFASGYEPADDGNALAAVPHIDEPDDGEHDRADEIDDEILHRVDQPMSR